MVKALVGVSQTKVEKSGPVEVVCSLPQALLSVPCVNVVDMASHEMCNQSQHGQHVSMKTTFNPSPQHVATWAKLQLYFERYPPNGAVRS